MTNLHIMRQLQGKRVLLVGGGDTEYDNEHSDFHVVIRINDRYKGHRRTDALIVGSAINLDFSEELQPMLEWIAINRVDARLAELKQWADYNALSTVEFDTTVYREAHPLDGNEWLNKLGKEIHTTPLTGIVAVAMLLQCPLSWLHITGFTFYANEELKEVPAQIGCHQVRPQIDWLRSRFESDCRLTSDYKTIRVLTDTHYKRHGVIMFKPD